MLFVARVNIFGNCLCFCHDELLAIIYILKLSARCLNNATLVGDHEFLALLGLEILAELSRLLLSAEPQARDLRSPRLLFYVVVSRV